MRNQKEILAEAANSLFRCTNIEAAMEDGDQRDEVYLNIAGERFVVEVQPEITKGNKGIILKALKNISLEKNLPILLVTKYIPGEIINEYAGDGINYLDIAGNCNIRKGNLFIYIEGKKVKRMAKVNQPRAFREAGIKLLFVFLTDPEKIRLSYRDLVRLANISLGSVAMIMQELIDLNFILITRHTRKLKNTSDLLNRWITAYHDVLRPRLLKKKMRFITQDSYNRWKTMNLSRDDRFAYWGGEPAANLLTGYLHPGKFTIYTNQNWSDFKALELVPDEHGNVEILEMFWENEISQGVPPVLVYADLMSSGSDRNIETANIIFNNELQYLK